MSRKRLLRDRIRLRVTSADIWGSIQQLNSSAIPVFSVQQEDDLTYSFQISRKHFRALQGILTKRGDSVALIQSSLLSFIRQSFLKRPLLSAGVTLFFAVSLLLPTRILQVEVQGNHLIPTRKILEEADKAGISLFSSCAEVRSEKMKNALLSAIPQLQWAGINTYGCRAVISVRERAEPEKQRSDTGMVSSIIAARDGIIQSVTASGGSIQCKEGQAVKLGQVLISGFTDCGLCIRAERSQGEIYAQTLRNVQCVTPIEYQRKSPQQQVKQRYSVILGKKRINLWKDSGIWDSTCGRISKEYRLTLPGGFSLPVSVICESLSWSDREALALDENTAKAQLDDFSREYVTNQMIAGRILGAEEELEKKSGIYLLSGRYVCSEMIGRERLEIGVPHEQSD